MSLYLYCLREAAETKPESPASVIKAPAIDGGRVFCCVFDGIEAVVSEVNTDNFMEMQKKAQEDVHWIKEKALAHETVVGKAMENLIPVIPVKFGVIFNNDERLSKVISEQITAIRTTFDRIRGKQEWSVKLFLKDNQRFKELVREQNEQLSEKSKALAALPAGRAYFMEEEFNEELERECSRRLDEEAMKMFEELKPFAAEATLVKILDSKLTGRNERMVLNSAYLVADSRLPEFENAVVKLREKFALRGFLAEQSGPWPAYHFTEFAHES